jgi:hypothetical protein
MLSQDPPQDPEIAAKGLTTTTKSHEFGRFMRLESSGRRTTVHKAAPVSDKSQIEIRPFRISQHRTYPDHP